MPQGPERTMLLLAAETLCGGNAVGLHEMRLALRHRPDRAQRSRTVNVAELLEDLSTGYPGGTSKSVPGMGSMVVGDASSPDGEHNRSSNNGPPFLADKRCLCGNAQQPTPDAPGLLCHPASANARSRGRGSGRRQPALAFGDSQDLALEDITVEAGEALFRANGKRCKACGRNHEWKRLPLSRLSCPTCSGSGLIPVMTASEWVEVPGKSIGFGEMERALVIPEYRGKGSLCRLDLSTYADSIAARRSGEAQIWGLNPLDLRYERFPLAEGTTSAPWREWNGTGSGAVKRKMEGCRIVHLPSGVSSVHRSGADFATNRSMAERALAEKLRNHGETGVQAGR